MDNKKLRYIIITLITITLLFGLTTKAYASFIDYDGKPPSHPGHGVWWTGEGVGKAWSDFYNAQMKAVPPKYKSEAGFVKAVNRGGNGAQKPDGSYETFWETCQKSKYIYWYGSYRVWVDEGPPKYYYFPQTWYTSGGTTNNANWNSNSQDAKDTFEDYKNWSSQWTGGKVVLICSYAFERPKPDPEGIELLFKANSGTFSYDGSPKTVSGLHPDSNYLDKLKPGHRAEAVATKTETNVGTYPVTFSKIVIYDKDNKDITDSGLYKIKKEDGQLKINEKPNPVIPPEGEDPEIEWRCIDNQDDSAKAYVFNETIGSHGFTPNGAGSLRRTYGSRYTPAGIFAMGNPPPQKYDVLSDWKSWKSTFENGSDEITPELNLQGAGVSNVLSKYGGVYNIDRSLREDTYYVEHCQPQERYLEIETESGRSIRIDRESDWDYYMYENIYIEYYGRRYDEEVEGVVVDYYFGRYPEDDEICVRDDRGRDTWILLDDIIYWEMTFEEWSEWEDVGERIVWDDWGPSRDFHEFNYQILSVNCNKTGFDRIMRSYGDDDRSYANGDGGAVLKTRENEGRGPGVLGRSGHETARDTFYLDGTSCNVFACTARPLSGPDVEHDGNNNKNNDEFFQSEYNDGREYGKLGNGKDYLVYFRDNVDNEVRADVWYPKSTGLNDLISFPEEVARGTTGKLFGGSPEIELTTIKPIGSSRWGFDRMQEELSWRGQENRFIMKSQWASYDNDPYEMGLIWEYEGEGINQVPAKVDGYEVLSDTSPYYYYFDVACPFKNDERGRNDALIPKSPFINRRYTPSWDPNHAIRTLFIRSVSDS